METSQSQTLMVTVRTAGSVSLMECKDGNRVPGVEGMEGACAH